MSSLTITSSEIAPFDSKNFHIFQSNGVISKVQRVFKNESLCMLMPLKCFYNQPNRKPHTSHHFIYNTICTKLGHIKIKMLHSINLTSKTILKLESEINISSSLAKSSKNNPQNFQRSSAIFFLQPALYKPPK